MTNRFPAILVYVLATLIALAAAACAGDSDDPASGPGDRGPTSEGSGRDVETPDAYPESCAAGPEFAFDPDSSPRVVPFPNDLYAWDDPGSPTGRRIFIDGDVPQPIGSLARRSWFGSYVEAYNHLDGFSPLADLYVPVGDEPVAHTLPDVDGPGIGDGVFLVALDDNADFAPIAVEWRTPHLVLTPWFPLKERTRYALVATRALSPAAGGCYRASAGMRAAWEAWDGGDDDRYGPILDRLADLGLAAGEVLSIADFTTGWPTRQLETARTVLDEEAVDEPSAFYDWEIVPDADPRLWATAHATFDVPIFKPDGGSWIEDDDGRPRIDRREAVRAYFMLPTADANEAGQPYPILVFGHGMFNSKHEIRPPFTTEAAAAGFAMVAIDAVCHGDRLPPGAGDVEQFLCFYDLLHPEAMRDNFRESAANLVWLVRSLDSLAGLDLDGNGTPDFDTERVYHLGSSFGSIVGGSFAAIDDRIDAHVLAASGAKLTSIAFEGEAAEYFDLIESIERLLLPEQPITDILVPLAHVLQSVLDPADSANFLAHVQRDPLPVMDGYAPQVFQQGSAYDDTVGGPSGGWLCRAGGWPQIEPVAWDVGTPHVDAPYTGSAFYQFDTDEHTLIFDDHAMGRAARSQLLHFLTTHVESGVGEIVDPLAERD